MFHFPLENVNKTSQYIRTSPIANDKEQCVDVVYSSFKTEKNISVYCVFSGFFNPLKRVINIVINRNDTVT